MLSCCNNMRKPSGVISGAREDLHPVKIIFDTDLGNDIDDVLALQMLLNYHKKGVVDLLAITISKANPFVIEYIDGYCRYNHIPDIPLGFVYSGVTPEDGGYVRQTLDATYNGKRILEPLRSLKDDIPVASDLIRKILSEQADSSVVLIAVGPETNLSRLLMSKPDQYSSLSGVALVKKKVKLVSVMGGNYDRTPFPEWNIITDLDAARYFFSHCPVPVIASGYEVGNALLFPSKSIDIDSPDKEGNPLYISYSFWGEMPYDRPSWDMTSVLVVAETEQDYFHFSPSGLINIDTIGNSIFTPKKEGLHRFLILDESKKDLALELLIKSVIAN